MKCPSLAVRRCKLLSLALLAVFIVFSLLSPSIDAKGRQRQQRQKVRIATARRPLPKKVLLLPRIPVKPNAAAASMNNKAMTWCDYLRKLGVESLKCIGNAESNEEDDRQVVIVVANGELSTTSEKLEKKGMRNKEESGTLKKNNTDKKGEKVNVRNSTDEAEQEMEEKWLRFSSVENSKVEAVGKRSGKWPSCQGHFESCRSSRECRSGILCRNRLTGEKCCKHRSDTQCPSSEKLGYSCLQKNPVNWCNVNSDCGANSFRSYICCPTGCGYNVCISNIPASPPTRRLMQMEARTNLLSPDCPSPFLIRIKCVVPRPTSWCQSARECPTYNKEYPRRCCLTPCGYNVCLTKFEDNGWIIA